MKWKILQLIGLLALALGALFAVPAIATAHTAPATIHPGSPCAHDRHLQLAQADNGLWYQCLPPKHGDGAWHWKGPVSGPSSGPTIAPTQPASPTPSATTAPPQASPTPSVSGSAAGALPVTGAREDWMAAAGVAALGAGGTALWLGRRRRSRVRFTS